MGVGEAEGEKDEEEAEAEVNAAVDAAVNAVNVEELAVVDQPAAPQDPDADAEDVLDL